MTFPGRVILKEAQTSRTCQKSNRRVQKPLIETRLGEKQKAQLQVKMDYQYQHKT